MQTMQLQWLIDENGYKDFSEIINKALELGGFEKDEE